MTRLLIIAIVVVSIMTVIPFLYGFLLGAVEEADRPTRSNQ